MTQTPQQLARSLLIGFALLGTAFWLIPAWKTGAWSDVPMGSRVIWALGFVLAFSCYLGGPIGRAVYRFFTAFQRVVEQVLTSLSLAIVYVIVLGPIALYMKLRRRDRLQLRRPEVENSYWRQAEGPSTRETSERQF